VNFFHDDVTISNVIYRTLT